MTYSAHSSLASRTASLAISAAIHAVLGFALFFSLPAGTPDTSARHGERGEVLVVELLPLPDGGSPGEGHERRNRARSESVAVAENAGDRPGLQPSDMTRPPGSPPRGDGGVADASGKGGMDDNRDGAPALSGAEVQAFRERLLRHIERFRRYPPQARAAGQEGIVRIQFVMDQAGNVTDAWIERSSGSPWLDEEAIAAVMRARPLPAPPSSWPRSFGVSLPIGFALQ